MVGENTPIIANDDSKIVLFKLKDLWNLADALYKHCPELEGSTWEHILSKSTELLNGFKVPADSGIKTEDFHPSVETIIKKGVYAGPTFESKE